MKKILGESLHNLAILDSILHVWRGNPNANHPPQYPITARAHTHAVLDSIGIARRCTSLHVAWTDVSRAHAETGHATPSDPPLETRTGRDAVDRRSMNDRMESNRAKIAANEAKIAAYEDRKRVLWLRGIL